MKPREPDLVSRGADVAILSRRRRELLETLERPSLVSDARLGDRDAQLQLEACRLEIIDIDEQIAGIQAIFNEAAA